MTIEMPPQKWVGCLLLAMSAGAITRSMNGSVLPSLVLFTHAVKVTVSGPFKNCFHVVPRQCFEHSIKTIKGAARKNGDVDGKCKRTLTF